jgi:hypothetical protein
MIFSSDGVVNTRCICKAASEVTATVLPPASCIAGAPKSVAS